MSKISELLADVLQKFAIEEEKAEKGNHAASVRARKALMQIKQIASEGRKKIAAAKYEKRQGKQAAA